MAQSIVKPITAKHIVAVIIYYGTIIVRLDEDILEGEYFDSNNISGHIEMYRKD